MKHALGLVLLVAVSTSSAQDEMPTVNTESPSVNTSPAVPAPTAPTSTPTPGIVRPTTRTTTRSGSTIVGEQETPLGLYIMPWRGSAAASGLDRPARFLREALVPVDSDVFRRQNVYYRALSEHLEKSGRATP